MLFTRNLLKNLGQAAILATLLCSFAFAQEEETGEDAYEDEAEEEIEISEEMEHFPEENLPKISYTQKNMYVARIGAFSLSVLSFGLGFWQNYEANVNSKKAKRLYGEMDYVQDKALYDKKHSEYKNAKSDARRNETFRNNFYIGSGIFGGLGIASIIIIFF